jgi:Leucine-rich repeat (LRR) protein
MNLNDNKFEYLSKSICDLVNLAELQIGFNQIKDLIFEP